MPWNMADVDGASRLPDEMGASTARLETAAVKQPARASETRPQRAGRTGRRTARK